MRCKMSDPVISGKDAYLRRLYSTFAGGWPGTGLFLMRVVAGSALVVRAGFALPWTTRLAPAFESGDSCDAVDGAQCSSRRFMDTHRRNLGSAD